MVDIETVMTGIVDEMGPTALRFRFPILLGVCTIFFVLGIPQTCQVESSFVPFSSHSPPIYFYNCRIMQFRSKTTKKKYC